MKDRRIADLIHHVTTLCSPADLGRTKIAKVLWLADVDYYRRTGKTITGSDEYVKDTHGPRHRHLYDALNLLVKEHKVQEFASPTPVGFRREYHPVAHPDVSSFTSEEIAVLDRVTAFVCRKSAKEISELTHDDLWESANMNERIPVAAASPILGDVTPEIIAWAETAFDEHSSTS